MFQNADGVPENKIEALRWFELAAKQGDADAQYSLGWIYDYGEGVIENDMLALFYYRKAAEKNLPENFKLDLCIYIQKLRKKQTIH